MSTILDAVADATTSVQRVYELGTVPEKPEYPYSVYSSSLGPGLGYTLDSSTDLRDGEIVIQSFGRTDGSAGGHMELTTAALLDRLLTDTDSRWVTTPLRQDLKPTTVRASEPENAGVIGKTAVLTFTWQETTP